MSLGYDFGIPVCIEVLLWFRYFSNLVGLDDVGLDCGAWSDDFSGATFVRCGV